jgi:hypothetical protein
MQLVEIRDLDGPNLFVLRPAIKIEFTVDPNESIADSIASSTASMLGLSLPSDPVEALKLVIDRLHQQANLPEPEIGARRLDQRSHVAQRAGEVAAEAEVPDEISLKERVLLVADDVAGEADLGVHD